MTTWDSTRWPNFTEQEVACSHCGELGVTEDALDTLQALRTAIQKPMTINSGYRCPEHNQAIGGAEKSYHVRGLAFDISLQGHDKDKLSASAQEAGFKGFGYYDTFLHVDTGPSRVWGKA
jgi:zinc D-Ala-D-Ala carboxypeptidase